MVTRFAPAAFLAILALAGCTTQPVDQPQSATFEMVIKEIDADKTERVVQRPYLSTVLNKESEWASLATHQSLEGTSREGYTVQVLPKVDSNPAKTGKAVLASFLVHQYTPTGETSFSNTYSLGLNDAAISNWAAGGKQYVFEARLTSLQ
ncbi:hypothetical protein [Pseudomonas nitroreducens]|uniref:hypothetical protein n=1 Tax=Pseudomonas nitroreducens TaxID=46680 RepID=UPI00351D5D1B